MKQNNKKNVGDDLTLTVTSKIDLTRLSPCFSKLLPHIYRANHHLVFYKRADESFIEALNPYEDELDWLKNQNSLLGAIWRVELFLSSALIDIVKSEEQER